MSIDFRKRLKGSKLSNITEGKKEAESRTKSYSKKGYVGNHDIEDGDNYFRLMPAHNAQVDPPFQANKTSFLQINSPVYEDGEKTDKTAIKPKPIFIATTHGLDKDGHLMKKCPIELYINKVYEKVYEETQDEKEQKKKLNPLKAYPGGIMPKTVYTYYAWKGGELARLDLKPSVVNQMEEISLKSSKSGSDIDVFTDIDDGIKLVVTKRGKKLETKYTASKDEIADIIYLDGDDLLKAKAEFKKRQQLSDEQIEEFFKVKPLKEILGPGVYKLTDFEFAVEGLMRFDEKNGYAIFEDEDYVNQLAEIKESIPEKEEADKEEDNALIDAGKKVIENKENKPPIKTEETNVEGDTSKWNKIKCKKYLNAYILENYGTDKTLPEALTLSELRQWSTFAIDGDELPFSEEEIEVDTNAGASEQKDSTDNIVNSTDETNEDSITERLRKLKGNG